MAEKNRKDVGRTGLYEKTVQWITERIKPGLNKRTMRFINKSVEKYAPDNPRFARMIEFEVRRRGDGAGLTQDVAEPLLWVGVKTALAMAIAVVAAFFTKPKGLKWIGWGAALALIANNAVEVLRLIPRYTAGLQGSLEMALDRIRSVKKTGVDPFNQQQSAREINIYKENAEQNAPETSFAQKTPKSPEIVPTTLAEQASRIPQAAGRQ